MQSISSAKFFEAIKDEKVVVIFHKHGCSNCAKMLPQMQELSEHRPDIKVYEMLIDEKDKDSVDFYNKHIRRKFPRDAQFPYAIALQKWKTISGLFAVFNPELLTHSFIETDSLANTLGTMQIAFDDLEEQHKQLIQELKREEAVIKAIIKRKRLLDSPEVPDEWNFENKDDFILPTPTISEDEKQPCESWCQ